MKTVKSIFFMLLMPALLVGDYLVGHPAFLFVYSLVMAVVLLFVVLAVGISAYGLDAAVMSEEQIAKLRKTYEPLNPQAMASLTINLASIGYLLYAVHFKAAVCVILFTSLVFVMRHMAKTTVEKWEKMDPEVRRIATAFKNMTDLIKADRS